jgi:ribosomal-protein-alanine N-acetyltransferase
VGTADLPAIDELEKLCFLTPWRSESFRESVDRPFTFFLSLRDGGEIVGYVLSWLTADEIHLLKIAVRPDARRRGYGAQLLDETIRRAVAAGATTIWLEVRPSNDAALGLYASRGFHHAYTRKKYFVDTNEDALIFVRRLAPEGIAG